jgi:Platelet-activating factor acetylhydrolase, isoform II
MRVFEIALILVNLLILACCASARALPGWTRLLPGIALLLMISQIKVEGHRWQMYPAYLVTAWLFLSSIWPRMAELGMWTGVAGLSCLLGAATMGTILPVFEFPTPRGPLAIGTVSRHLVDMNREETQGDRPGTHRELMVQIWYPAERRGPGEAYRLRRELPFKKEHLALVRTHAAAGAPLARTLPRFPVLIFSPCWNGCRNQNTFQVEELVSHGFVVVGLDHPYSSAVTTFPDGRTVRSTLADHCMDFSSDEAFEASLRTDGTQLQIRTADVRFVLDELERLDQYDATGLLTGRLDTARVGIFGHSFGGAVAAEACRLDSRFRAGIDLDSVLYGESATEGVAQPFLFMNCDSPVPMESELASSSGPRRRYLTITAENLRNKRKSLATHGGYWISIQGIQHMNFCDTPLYATIKRLTGAGPIDVARAMRIINDYTIAFFCQYLMMQPQGLLEGPSPQYPEVHFEAWQPLPK